MIIINSTTYLLKRIHLEHNLNVPLVAKLRGSEYTTGAFYLNIWLCSFLITNEYITVTVQIILLYYIQL